MRAELFHSATRRFVTQIHLPSVSWLQHHKAATAIYQCSARNNQSVALQKLHNYHPQNRLMWAEAPEDCGKESQEMFVLRKLSCPSIQEPLWQLHSHHLSWDRSPFTVGGTYTLYIAPQVSACVWLCYSKYTVKVALLDS